MSIEELSIGGVPTTTVRLLSRSAEALVLVVPGNPGVARMYLPFAQHLHAVGEGRLSVAVAGHAGHAPGYTSPSGYFGLKDQVAHHEQFWRALPEHPIVHVVGHSIGAWLGLKIFDGLPAARRGRAFLLFPALERLAETPNGRQLAPLFGVMRSPTVAFARLLHHLPGRDWFLNTFMLYEARPEVKALMLEGALEISGTGLNNVLRMAKEEMEQVVACPEDLLQKYSDVLSIYYGEADPWNLPDMPERMANRFPSAEVVRCPHGFSHSFVFDGSRQMADFVAARVLPLRAEESAFAI